MIMATSTVIEVTAGEVTEVLTRQGISPDERVTVTIEPELMPGRRESRARVIAAGLSDDDIDRLIKLAQREVEPLLP
jgi:ribosomal protein L12E/L44/L45/RPP1/RPP2